MADFSYIPAQQYINGQWVAPASGQTIDMLSPSDSSLIGKIARGNARDIDDAVRAARRAFEGAWGKTPAFERGRLLMQFRQLILQHVDELAQIEAADAGKPMKAARNDILATARYFEFYAGAADKVHGDTIPFLEGYQVMILREPRGVTGHIIPWNYPAQMFGRTLGAALATGNAVVLKPAEEASLCVVRLVQLAAQLPFPPGTINLVSGYGEEAGAALSAHPGIDFLSFTGSPEVGTLVQTAAAKNHVPCVLELGGKSPQIVFEDANLDKVVPVVVGAIIQNAGQTCSAGSRVLVQRSIYDKFVPLLAARMKQIKAGSHDADLDLGPVISKVQCDRVKAFLERAAKDGIPVIAQGEVAAGSSTSGYYVPPTILGPVPLSHELAYEEVFGPVLAVIPFDDEEDAIRIANGTEYGLIAGVWTENGGRQLRMAKKLRVGQVYLNGYGAGGGIELPFGGFKRSGHGREKGFEALKEYTVAKTVVFNHG